MENVASMNSSAKLRNMSSSSVGANSIRFPLKGSRRMILPGYLILSRFRTIANIARSIHVIQKSSQFSFVSAQLSTLKPALNGSVAGGDISRFFEYSPSVRTCSN
jgi:hypothetical protein